MEIKDVIEISNYGEITAVLGNVSLSQINILPNFVDNESIYEQLLKISDKDKILKALPVLNISEQTLKLTGSKLSNSQKNKLAVIVSLLSKENVYIFYNVNKSLSYRESENVKRIFKKLAEHNKKVIIVTTDTEFLFGLCKRVFIKDNDSYKEFNPINWFDNEIYKYISKPPIIEFVCNCKSRGIKIDDCYETKELLKAIYRSVDK